ncbi:MAG: class I SAM-dependent methyltransferase [Bacteroidia bacterium]|nr:class I SAM-dependent methyltransferase [Bacteroidia bacterium]
MEERVHRKRVADPRQVAAARRANTPIEDCCRLTRGRHWLPRGLHDCKTCRHRGCERTGIRCGHRSKQTQQLEDHLKARGLSNVALVRGDADNPHLPVAALDAVIIVDTYHEMDAHDTILKHILTALKPHGRLVLCEPIADERRKATRADQEGRHELAMAYAIADLRKAGFTIILQQDPFIDRKAVKGDVMWMVVAEKPGY